MYVIAEVGYDSPRAFDGSSVKSMYSWAQICSRSFFGKAGRPSPKEKDDEGSC